MDTYTMVYMEWVQSTNLPICNMLIFCSNCWNILMLVCYVNIIKMMEYEYVILLTQKFSLWILTYVYSFIYLSVYFFNIQNENLQ